MSRHTTANRFTRVVGVAGVSLAALAVTIVASGSATSEGELTLSTDGTTLHATGYNVNIPPGVSSVASTTSSSTADQRVVAEVNVATGNIDSSTQFSSLYSGNNIRGAGE